MFTLYFTLINDRLLYLRGLWLMLSRFNNIVIKILLLGEINGCRGLTEGSEFESSQEFSFLQIVQTGSEVHATSYPMGTGGSFSGGKAAGA
jgi:hypothetical protein